MKGSGAALLAACAVLIAVPHASAKSPAQERPQPVVIFENRTCGDIVVSAVGNDRCFGDYGCLVTVAKNKNGRVALRRDVRPRWAKVGVEGTCGEPEPATIAGECPVDLSQIFGASPSAPPRPVPAPGPFGEDRLRSPDDGGRGPSNMAVITIRLDMCEPGPGGVDLCTIACTASR